MEGSKMDEFKKKRDEVYKYSSLKTSSITF